MTTRDPAFPATFLGATVIIGPDAEYSTFDASGPHPFLNIAVAGGPNVVTLRFDPPQLLDFASVVRDIAANWVQCAECDGTILRDAAYTPDTGMPVKWAPVFCGGPCAEQWSQRNDPAVTR